MNIGGTILNRITSTFKSRSTPITTVKKTLVSENVFFELQVRDIQGILIENEIIAGCKYLIVVTASQNSLGTTNITQNAVKLSSDLWFKLQIEAPDLITNKVDLKSEANKTSLTELTSLDFRCNFEIVIGNDCAGGEIKIHLLYREKEDGSWHVGSLLSSTIKGEHHLPSSHFTEKCRVKIGEKAPPGTIFLHVIPEGENKFSFEKWDVKDSPKTSGLLALEKIGLGNFVENEMKPILIRNRIRDFSSRDPGGIISWLKPLYEKHKENLTLIVLDEPGYEIPWELIELYDDIYLGAIAKIVRWVQVGLYGEQKHLSFSPVKSTGKVLAFFSDEIAHTETENQALSKFNSFTTDLEHLESKLRNSLADTGLVYIACHGIFHYDEEHRKLIDEGIKAGILTDKGLTITPIDLQQALPIVKSDTPPVFFINACHSARVLSKNKEKDVQQVFYGLPVIILQRSSNSFVGTVGKVNSACASQIARFIFEEIKKNENGADIVELLRLVREKYVKELIKSPTDETWLNFITAFMYVYYGSPSAQVVITSKEESANG